MVVLAGPLAVARVADPKVHVRPGTVDEQDNATLPAKPLDGVTINVTGTDCPAVTVTLEGFVATAKSGAPVTSVTTVEEVLPAKVPAPANVAVME
jgi:hypothetical protein